MCLCVDIASVLTLVATASVAVVGLMHTKIDPAELAEDPSLQEQGDFRSALSAGQAVLVLAVFAMGCALSGTINTMLRAKAMELDAWFLGLDQWVIARHSWPRPSYCTILDPRFLLLLLNRNAGTAGCAPVPS